ncbi:MAG TPA: hypothetical protein VE954_27410 [Oligoflexus sp.]|uniref:hypothetical protein n=1 Tax=Oligoflexus sp. TaxID=1971216 RepID=UPI002D3773D3|nr:hypothetical protein [Oligoflexus sp.]HYX36853.1 hypothetical protein [Oligoflexus sp.]
MHASEPKAFAIGPWPGYVREATALGYAPFVQLSPLEYLAIVELHGRWAFREVLQRLEDPTQIHRGWAVRFLGAASMLPRDELEAASDIHGLVTSSPGFRLRDKHRRAFWKAFFKVYKRMKRAHRELPELPRLIYRADLDHWSQRLKDRQLRSNSKSMERVSKKKLAPTPAPASLVPIIIRKVRDA